MKPKMLITGFEDFGFEKPYPPNPSWKVARRAAALNLDYVEIHCERIPVLWRAAEGKRSTWEAIKEYAVGKGYDTVISVGAADSLKLECTGRNEAYRIQDNASNYYLENQNQYVVPLEDGADAEIDATIPWEWLLANYPNRRTQGSQDELTESHNAQGYLCNLALYESLRHLEEIPNRGFIHTGSWESSINGAVLAIQMIAEKLYAPQQMSA